MALSSLPELRGIFATAFDAPDEVPAGGHKAGGGHKKGAASGGARPPHQQPAAAGAASTAAAAGGGAATAASAAAAPSDPACCWYYMDKYRVQQGPVRAEEIVRLYKLLQLNDASLVWCAAGPDGGASSASSGGGGGWVRLAESAHFDGQIGPEVLESSRAERESFLAAEAKKEENKKRKREKAALNQSAGSRWKKAPVNHSNVYFTGLPSDVTAEELGEFAKKAGIIQTDEEGRRRVKIYLDDQGRPKGDGLVKYALADSVPLAITLLDQAVFRPPSAKNPTAVVVGVQKATFEMKGDAFDASKVDPKLLLAAQHKRAKLAGGAAAAEAKKHEVGALTAAEIQRQKLAESLSWAEDDSYSGAGSSRLRIVILKPMFTPADAAAHPDGEQAFYDELRDEIGAEVEAKVSQAAVVDDEPPSSSRAGPRKAGCIDKLTVFAGNPEGPVAVKFRSSAHAAACIALMNGRYFAGRTLSAFYFDGRTNYVVQKADDDAETEKRLKEFGDWIEKGEDEE